MSGSVNKCIIIGNLCADPETRSFPNGGKVCSLRVATNETWRDKNSGEKRERAEFHKVEIYSEPLAKVAEQYLRKGSKVYIEGQLETRKWQDQSGADRYTTEVALRPFRSELTMLDGKPSSVSGEWPDRGSSHDPKDDYREKRPTGGGYGGGDLDDDIPFAPEWR